MNTPMESDSLLQRAEGQGVPVDTRIYQAQKENGDRLYVDLKLETGGTVIGFSRNTMVRLLAVIDSGKPGHLDLVECIPYSIAA